MKNLKLPSVAMVILMAVPAFGQVVQTVSESFVGSAVTIPGVQGAGARISFFSLRTVRPALYAGKVTALNSTSVTDSGANWTTALFANRGPLYAEFNSGLEADIAQINYSNKRLSFSGPLPPSLTVGTPFRIREHHTISEIFGPQNQAGLRSGANTDEAETIRHFLPETQQTQIYFHSNLDGLTGWLLDNYSSASNIVVYPEQGLMVRRLGTANLTLTSSGPLKQHTSTMSVYPGYNMLGVYNRATPVRLDQLNLLAAGFVRGENADIGDNLLTFNPDGTSSTYFYSSLVGFEGWLDYNYQPAAGVTLSPGTVFMLYRRPPSQILEWSLPAQ